MIRTRWPRHLSANDALFYQVADVPDVGFLEGRAISEIEPLLQPRGSVVSIAEAWPLFYMIPDMVFADKAKNSIGTVTFTLHPDDYWRWPYLIRGDFKSTEDTSIETKYFKRSDKATKDKRCVFYP